MNKPNDIEAAIKVIKDQLLYGAIVELDEHINRNEIETILSTLEAQRDGGWQPIETAPKDGTVVDLWGELFHDKSHCRFPDCYWTLMTNWKGDEYEGWFLGSGNGRSSLTPTHWKPRDAPPKTEGE